MTITARMLLGVALARPVMRGEELGLGPAFFSSLTPAQRYLYLLLFGVHWQHALELCVAVAYYVLLWPRHFAAAGELHWASRWALEVLAFNLACEIVVYGGWHLAMYGAASPLTAGGRLAQFKFNQADQYVGEDGRANLGREVLFCTLGWLQSAAWQILVMHALRRGVAFPAAAPDAIFVSRPLFAAATVLSMSFWRYAHFYLAHRVMHPWGAKLCGVDPGQALYDAVHSLHHKSYNPGPFSGLSMHPVEHLFYYSCVLLPVSLGLHPLAFLFTKFHADISPAGGHDGFMAPGGDSTYHYIHHSKFHVNYSVPAPLCNLDWLFGTEASYDSVKECGGNLEKAIALTQSRTGSGPIALRAALRWVWPGEVERKTK